MPSAARVRDGIGSPERPMRRRSPDFMSDQVPAHRRFRVLNVVDDHCRLCPGQIVDGSTSGARVARFLDDLALEFGPPREIVLDDGPEGTSRAMFAWSGRTGVRLVRRALGPGAPRRSPSNRASPAPDAYIGSFGGSVRDERRSLHSFRPLQHVREEIGRWRDHYNTARPHSVPGYLSPMEFRTTDAATAPKTPAVSAQPPDTHTRPEASQSRRP